MTCGHTHFPLVAQHGDVLYLNSGTWTDFPPCPFVAVQGDQVRLEYWPPDRGAATADETSSTVCRKSVADEPIELRAHSARAETLVILIGYEPAINSRGFSR